MFRQLGPGMIDAFKFATLRSVRIEISRKFTEYQMQTFVL